MKIFVNCAIKYEIESYPEEKKLFIFTMELYCIALQLKMRNLFYRLTFRLEIVLRSYNSLVITEPGCQRKRQCLSTIVLAYVKSFVMKKVKSGFTFNVTISNNLFLIYLMTKQGTVNKLNFFSKIKKIQVNQKEL